MRLDEVLRLSWHTNKTYPGDLVRSLLSHAEAAAQLLVDVRQIYFTLLGHPCSLTSPSMVQPLSNYRSLYIQVLITHTPLWADRYRPVLLVQKGV
jgi:hypothetical protein